jgi:hypothetical protein
MIKLEAGTYKSAKKKDGVGKADITQETWNKVDETKKQIMKDSKPFTTDMVDKEKIGIFLLKLSASESERIELEKQIATEAKGEFEALKEAIARIGCEIKEKSEKKKKVSKALNEMEAMYDFVMNSSLYSEMQKNVKIATTKEIAWQNFKVATNWVKEIFASILKEIEGNEKEE